MSNFNGDVIFKRHNYEYKKNCPIYITSNYGVLCNGMIGFIRDKIGRNLLIEVEGNLYEVMPSKINFVPGFAMTIHKVQSKTFPGINIYIKKSDIYKDRSLYIRLLYVALTRVRDFGKCYICLY